MFGQYRPQAQAGGLGFGAYAAPTSTVEKEVANLERRLRAVGVEPPAPKQSALMRLFDLLQRPIYGIAGLTKEVIQPGESFQPLQEFAKGITGREKETFRDVAKALGVSERPLFKTELKLGSFRLPIAPTPAGIVGLLGDIFLDPLTYLTAGAGGVAKGGLQLSTKAAPLLPKLPELKVAVPGTKAAVEALGLAEKMEQFRKGFQQATRGLAPAGQAVKIAAKAEAPATKAVKERVLVPRVAEELKTPGLAAEEALKASSPLEEALRELYRDYVAIKQVPPTATVRKKPAVKFLDTEVALTTIPPAKLSAISKELDKTPEGILRELEDAVSRGISEDEFAKRVLQAAIPKGEKTPRGWMARTVVKKVPDSALTEETKVVHAPLRGWEKIGYRVGSNKIVQALGEAFSMYFGLHPEVAKAHRQMRLGMAMDEEEILNRAKNFLKIVPKESDRVAIAKWLDDPQNNPLPKGLEQAAKLFQREFERIGQAELEAGVLKELWPNYVTHIYKDDPETIRRALNKWAKQQQRTVSTMHGFAKERSLPTFAEAEKLGLHPEYDVARILAIRELAHSRVMRGRQLIEQIKQFPYLVRKADSPNIPHEFVRVTGVKGLEDYWVAPDVARFLVKMQNVFGDNEAMNAFVRAYDRFLSLWKSYATIANPGFNFRNMFGNFFNNWLGDVDERMYGVAEAVRRGQKGKVGEHTYDEIRRLARQHGVRGFGSWFGYELRRYATGEIKELGKRPSWYNPLSPEFAPLRAGRALGSAIEDNARLAHFIDRLAKGYSPEEAAASVRKYLFDYSELTPFESQFLRRMVPFYSWIRKNIPLQIESLVFKPGKYATVAKTERAIEQAAGGPVEPLPEWLKESRAVTTPIRTAQGRLLLLPRLPYEDISKLAPGQILRELVSSLTPVAQVPLELGLGVEGFTGRPIEEFPGQLVPFGGTQVPARAAYLPRQIPFVQNIERLLQPERADRRVLDLLASLAGIKMYPEEPAVASGQYERAQQIQNIIRQLEQAGIQVPTLAELGKGRYTGVGFSRFASQSGAGR